MALGLRQDMGTVLGASHRSVVKKAASRGGDTGGQCPGQSPHTQALQKKKSQVTAGLRRAFGGEVAVRLSGICQGLVSGSEDVSVP